MGPVAFPEGCCHPATSSWLGLDSKQGLQTLFREAGYFGVRVRDSLSTPFLGQGDISILKWETIIFSFVPHPL